MRYKISLENSEEGCAAPVLGLPGCHSERAAEAEVIANVQDAITMGAMARDAGLSIEAFLKLM